MKDTPHIYRTQRRGTCFSFVGQF